MSLITEQPRWNFEQEPVDEYNDETSYNLRAYFDRMDDAKLLQYCPEWTDEQVMEWCGDFTEDGNLLIACSERDIDVAEFRRVLGQCLEYRARVRGTL
jgi:hypothetical protein